MESSAFRSVGILGGSGPDAALQFASRVIYNARFAWASSNSNLPWTDVVAPSIHLISDPALGYSMDLAANLDELRAVVHARLSELSSLTDVIAIACNTLNYFGEEPQFRRDFPRVVWFQDILTKLVDIRRQSVILGVGSVAGADISLSPYRTLIERVGTRLSLHDVSDIAYLVKSGNTEEAMRRLAVVAEMHRGQDLILACTELPLVKKLNDSSIDLNDAVAKAIVISN